MTESNVDGGTDKSGAKQNNNGPNSMNRRDAVRHIAAGVFVAGTGVGLASGAGSLVETGNVLIDAANNPLSHIPPYNPDEIHAKALEQTLAGLPENDRERAAKAITLYRKSVQQSPRDHRQALANTFAQIQMKHKDVALEKRAIRLYLENTSDLTQAYGGEIAEAARKNQADFERDTLRSRVAADVAAGAGTTALLARELHERAGQLFAEKADKNRGSDEFSR